jgi:hypothetical protein
LLLNILSIFRIFLLEFNKPSITPVKIFLKLLIKEAETLDSDLIGIKHSPNESVRNVYVNVLILASFIICGHNAALHLPLPLQNHQPLIDPPSTENNYEMWTMVEA